MEKTKKIIRRVAIFGDAAAKEKDEHFRAAYQTAKLLAENGYIVVNGGGPGVMLAATLGAKSAGGLVEAVFLKEELEPGNYEGSSQRNLKLADNKIITDNYEDRERKIVELADAFVFFKGGTGTLSEMGMTWAMAKFEYGFHEPLVFYGKVWGKIIKELIEGLELEKIERRVVEVVESPEEVLAVLKKVSAKEERAKAVKPKTAEELPIVEME